jgi:outer membrane protein insertion porin family
MNDAQRGKGGKLTRILRCGLSAMLVGLLWLWGQATSASEHADGEGTRISEEVKVYGNRFFDAQRLISETRLEADSPFSTGRLESGIDRILNLYEENGFPYCQISPLHFKVSENGQVSFSFLVEEGPRVKITSVQLVGLRSTRERVILREMGNDVLGLFCQSRLEAGLKRIERLSYIERVDHTQLLAADDPEEGSLKISLQERKNNTFNGVLGYAPGTGNRKGVLFGSMDLAFDNIFGTGRMMQWNWSRKDPHSSQLFFLYREPWVLGFPPTLELSLMQVDYDSTYLKLRFSSRLRFNSTQSLSWGLLAAWEKVIPGPAGEGGIPDSRKYEVGADIALDHLNRPVNPRKGIAYGAGISYARKVNYATAALSPEKNRISSIRFNLDLFHLVPTLRAQTLFVGLHLKGLLTEEEPVPLSDQFELGGAGSVRGYREGAFLGTQVAWANLEYRFLLQGNSRFFLFADYGHFERKDYDKKDNPPEEFSSQKLGYGFGLRVDSRAGLLGIDYGLGEGDGITGGMIHFGITNRF